MLQTISCNTPKHVFKCRSTETIRAKNKSKFQRAEFTPENNKETFLKLQDGLLQQVILLWLIATSGTCNNYRACNNNYRACNSHSICPASVCLEQWLGCFRRRVYPLVLFLQQHFLYSQVKDLYFCVRFRQLLSFSNQKFSFRNSFDILTGLLSLGAHISNWHKVSIGISVS